MRVGRDNGAGIESALRSVPPMRKRYARAGGEACASPRRDTFPAAPGIGHAFANMIKSEQKV